MYKKIEMKQESNGMKTDLASELLYNFLENLRKASTLIPEVNLETDFLIPKPQS